MKKSAKISLIVIGVFIGIIFLDTMVSLVFNTSPFIKIRKNYNSYYVDKGLVINNYHCNNNERKTLFKWIKYTCPTISIVNPTKKVSLDNNVSLNIPDTWVVENKDNRFNIYPNSDNKNEYINIIIEKQIGTCGTGVSIKNFVLNNNKNATIAYSNKDNTWDWLIISTEDKDLLFSNHNLNSEDIEKSLDIIKNLNLV